MAKLQTSEVKLDDLKFIEKNPRRHTEIQINELKRSIEKFGQIRPLVIDEKNTVLAGNGLLVALRELGWSVASAYVIKGLSEKDKMRLALADNKIANLGLDNYPVIEELIQEIGDDLDIPGFDDQILRELVASQPVLTETASTYGVVSSDYINQATDRQEKLDKAFSSPAPSSQSGSEEVTYCETCGQRVWS